MNPATRLAPDELSATLRRLRQDAQLSGIEAARTRQQLLAIARDLQEEQVAARVMLRRGIYRMQERVGRIEAASRLLRTSTRRW
jgi:hypothetical protein